ncbi:MAG TPA: AbrB/MazE/SpoVT family DNA-binding domain-containing protein [Thermoanaerobaculia bacterium]|nr:AbrB/MazE/SpoVT family DNA-binding domain-containing protein [Thermoanaerobaculia bacterium]
MVITIDKAGRVVIPAETRRRVGLKPGTRLKLIEENHEIRLVPAVSPPKLVRRKGRLVAVPTVPEEERSPVDLGELMRQERDRWP